MKVRRRAFPDGTLACQQVRDLQAAVAGGGLSAEQALLPHVQHPSPLSELSNSHRCVPGVIWLLCSRHVD